MPPRIKLFDLLLSIRDELVKLVILKKTILTIDDASFLTGLSIHTLYKYSSQGILPSYKPNGKKLFFKRLELELWMLQNRGADSNHSDDVDDALFKNSRK